MNAIVVFVTAKDIRQAKTIAKALVDKRLAACCNIVDGIRSIYRWQGKVCDDKEVLLVIKTTRQKFSALEKEVKRLHSYETPEIISLPIVAGNKTYLQWLTSSVS